MLLQAEANSGNSSLSLTAKEFVFATQLSAFRQFMQQLSDQEVVDICDGLYSVAKK